MPVLASIIGVVRYCFGGKKEFFLFVLVNAGLLFISCI